MALVAEDQRKSNLQLLWSALQCLIKPSTDESAELKNLHEALQLNLMRTLSLLGFEDLNCIPLDENALNCSTDIIWDFVRMAMYVVSCIKDELGNQDLSVAQQKDIRTCFKFIVSLGIQPNALPGVIQDVSDKSPAFDLHEAETTVVEKYERLCVAVKFLLTCYNTSNFRPLIVSNILGSVLGALLQLSFAPIKKPVTDEVPSDLSKNFCMTFDLWNKMQKDQCDFRVLLDQLVRETYQPKIILELMVIQGQQRNKPSPLWLRKSSSNLLTGCLIQPGGVSALIRAMFDSTPDTGSDWKKIDTIANIISSPVHHYKSIASQLLSLLEASSNDTTDMQLVVVACIKRFYEKDSSSCQKLLIEPLLDPLVSICCSQDIDEKGVPRICSEGKVDSIVKQIHVCFALPSSKANCTNLPAKILKPFTPFLFQLLCKVHESVSLLCKFCEDLLLNIFCDCTCEDLTKIFSCILLGENDLEMHIVPKHLCFSFGPNGGICIETQVELTRNFLSSAVEESGNMIMALLEKKKDSRLFFLVFEVLLKMMVNIGMKPKKVTCDSNMLGTVEDTLASLMLVSERHLGIVRLLAALVENDCVQKELSKNPGPILSFIIKLLENLSEKESEDSECMLVAFMILNVILDNCGEETVWSSFESLLQPVKVIRDKTDNEELRRLASRVYTSIMTCGIEQESVLQTQKQKSKSMCEEALHDSCDPLLPVRGHALVQLTKLLQKRDPETLAKKEVVSCLFKENLKNSDSFIYLAAINGMVALAGILPDETVKVLTHEYMNFSAAGGNSSRDPDLRIKVGEILVKMMKDLGLTAFKYKNEFLNAYLVGTKDADHLMRASSLSNLGEVCQILGFRIGPILRELLVCIQSVLKFDQAVEPRRASVMVLTQLLRGLDGDTLIVLQDSALELYRSLKGIYCDDQDDVVRLHAQLALEELQRIAQDILFPKLPYEKKIKILL